MRITLREKSRKRIGERWKGKEKKKVGGASRESTSIEDEKKNTGRVQFGGKGKGERGGT